MSWLQSPLFGSASGQHFNDNTSIGNINKITSIVVNHGEIVDGLTITYNTSAGSKTAKHGGSGGNVTTINLSSDEFVVGVYGEYGFQSTFYGASSITQLQFVIVNRTTGIVRIAGPFATQRTGTGFAVTGEAGPFSGYVSGDYLQSLSVFYRN